MCLEVAGALGGMGSPDGALTPVVSGTGAPPVASSGTSAAGSGSTPAALQPAAIAIPVTKGGPGAVPAAPLAIHLAAAVSGTGTVTTGTASVIVAPAELTIQPDPTGPIGHATLTITNALPSDQNAWVSSAAPDAIVLVMAMTSPQIATVTVNIDLAQSAASHGDAPAESQLFVTTATGMTSVRVSWRPLPYGSM